MAKAFKFAKKVIISIAGFSLLIGGLILIPLPGPGLLLMLGGLLLLSMEFTWAKSYADMVKKKLKKIQTDSMTRYEKRLQPKDKPKD